MVGSHMVGSHLVGILSMLVGRYADAKENARDINERYTSIREEIRR